MKDYGVLYAKICFPSGHKLHWLGHCGLTNILPKEWQDEIKTLSSHINSKWKDSIVIPMDARIMPGCTTRPEVIDEVAKDIFDGMNTMLNKLVGESSVRLVYGVGSLDEDWIENKVTSTHEVGAYPIMIKVGRTLDLNWEPGIYKV